jgi:hypothetical protein
MSLRVRSTFIARNTPVISLFIANSSYAVSLQRLNNFYYTSILTELHKFFNQFIKILYPRTGFLKYVPVGVNFPVSAHYQGLKSLYNVTTGETTLTNLSNIPNQLFKYPYYSRQKVAITPVSKKPFKLTLYKLLRMTFNMWFTWPRSYRILANFTDINSSWFMARFLSKYFFKVYSI